VKIRFKKTYAAPDGATAQAGDIRDLDDDRARALLEGDDPAAEEVAEDAIIPEPGQAVTAGSFGGTYAPLERSGQTPGLAAPVPDPLNPAGAAAATQGLPPGSGTVEGVNAGAVAEEAEDDDKATSDEERADDYRDAGTMAPHETAEDDPNGLAREYRG
jgi:hypothetical protein